MSSAGAAGPEAEAEAAARPERGPGALLVTERERRSGRAASAGSSSGLRLRDRVPAGRLNDGGSHLLLGPSGGILLETERARR